jgi:NADH dehydrogenase/putative oxidoreductase
MLPQLDDKPAFSLAGLPRVGVVGAGFGGLTCASKLTEAPVKMTLIDRHNYHLFQPLLYQVATAGLSPGDIATPVRSMFRQRFNAEVLYGEVTGVDAQRQEVIMGTRRVPYDYLVLATGASHSYFGRDEWAAYAPGLKRVEDATEIRRRMLTAFELAEAAEDEETRRSLLTFPDRRRRARPAWSSPVRSQSCRVMAWRRSSATSIPPAPACCWSRQRRASCRRFRKRSRQSAPRARGARCGGHAQQPRGKNRRARCHGQRLARCSRTVMWAAGVVASPAARWLGAQSDNAGRLKVEADLSVPGLPNIYAVGDTALALAWKGPACAGACARRQTGR